MAGALIFLELLIGAPLLRLAIWLTGEQYVDKIGHACVLGAEGALTLTLTPDPDVNPSPSPSPSPSPTHRCAARHHA